MMDFGDIRSASQGQQIRAWAIEQSIDHLRPQYAHEPSQNVISLAKMIEDFVSNGEVVGAIQAAVEEGYREGRFQAKEAVESVISVDDGYGNQVHLNLDSLFVSFGWMKDRTGPEEGDDITID